MRPTRPPGESHGGRRGLRPDRRRDARAAGRGQGDTEDDARRLAEKIAGLRIFEDAEGKMNLALADVGGAMLVVSQFTLLGDCRKGRRPSFDAAAGPELAERLYQVLSTPWPPRASKWPPAASAQHMEVELVNDGPVTLLVEG